MDHFENIVRLILQADGYWVLPSFKVNLTKSEKRATGKHSIPRPEIDIIAYKPSAAEILAIEVKSFFDSVGVNPADIDVEYDIMTGKYKLFTCSRYRDIVLARLQSDLVDRGFLKSPLPIRLGLVAGKVKNGCGPELAMSCEKEVTTTYRPRM